MANRVAIGGLPVLLSASGIVSKVPGVLLGFLVGSTTAGTVQFFDNPSAGSGTAATPLMTPAAGQFVPCNADCATGCYAVIGGTISLTAVFAAG